MLAPAMVLIVFYLILPSLTLLRYSFDAYDPITLLKVTFTLENYVSFFTEPYFLSVLLTTVVIAIGCTFGSLLLGIPVAYSLARTQSRFKSLYMILTIFPLFMGNVVRAEGWIAAFGTKGFVNVVLLNLGIIDSPIHLMYTTFAVVVGALSVVLPIMILILQGVFESVDYSLMDAARNLGANYSVAARRVLLPIVLPGITVGSVFVFILCMNAYATPFLLGGPGFKMMAPVLYRQIARNSNWPMGSAIAFILMAVTILATMVSIKLLKRTR